MAEAPRRSLVEDVADYGATDTKGKRSLPSFPSFLSLRSLSPELLAECFGTFCLVLVVGCVVTGPAPIAWAPTAVASVLMAMVYVTGPISGGNLNPAVSLALAISGKLAWLQMFKYWAAQMFGALLGAATYRLLCAPNFVEVAPILPFGAGSCFTAECVYSFMLAFVVLSTAAKDFNGLAIGFSLVAAGHAVGGVSGAALNPAVALSLGLSAWQGLADLHFCLLWAAAELLGALLAAGAWRYLQPMQPPDLARQAAAELLGSFILVFTVGMNLVSRSSSTAFSAGAALMCMVYSLGDVSGAHLNPAVTLATWLCDKLGRRAAASYVLAQLLGGALAGLSCAAFHGVSANAQKSIQLTMGKHFNIWQASFAELAFTAILVHVVLQVTRSPKNTYFGLAIGSCVTLGGCAAGSISGGELNPAVCLGIYIANLVNPGHLGAGPVINLILFMIFELLGGAVAAGLAMVLVPTAGKDEEKAAESEAP